MTKNQKMLRQSITVIAIIIIALLLLGEAFRAPKPSGRVEYCVESGDTLWAIARRYKSDGMSYQKYIDDILKMNDGITAEIYAGQWIIIPIYE